MAPHKGGKAATARTMILADKSVTGPAISVVVPVYGCVSCLEQLCSRLLACLPKISNRFEIILVDDRSPDKAWAVIIGLQSRHPQVKAVRLSRNFGQQVAITAGLSLVRGDYTVVMDCDLQDPPEVILAMWQKLQEGHDIVLARRSQRTHSRFRLLAAKMYFRLLSQLNGERVDGSYGSFSMLSRKVVDAFQRFGERERHYLFILRWLGFEVATVEYEHQRRASGKSSYTLRMLIRHAADGILFQATVFLRWIVTLGLAFALFGLTAAVYLVYRHYVYGTVEGWTSVVVLLLVSTGVILLSLAVVGMYVGKIFDQTKDRPLFVIDRVVEDPQAW